MDEIDQEIHEIQDTKLNIGVKGDFQYFLVININIRQDISIYLTQHHLIDKILKDIEMDKTVKPKSTPTSSYQLFSRHNDSPEFEKSSDQISVIGKLNDLEKGSRIDIAYITHQCAHFLSFLKK